MQQARHVPSLPVAQCNWFSQHDDVLLPRWERIGVSTVGAFIQSWRPGAGTQTQAGQDQRCVQCVQGEEDQV